MLHLFRSISLSVPSSQASPFVDLPWWSFCSPTFIVMLQNCDIFNYFFLYFECLCQIRDETLVTLSNFRKSFLHLGVNCGFCCVIFYLFSRALCHDVRSVITQPVNLNFFLLSMAFYKVGLLHCFMDIRNYNDLK